MQTRKTKPSGSKNIFLSPWCTLPKKKRQKSVRFFSSSRSGEKITRIFTLELDILELAAAPPRRRRSEPGGHDRLHLIFSHFCLLLLLLLQHPSPPPPPFLRHPPLVYIRISNCTRSWNLKLKTSRPPPRRGWFTFSESSEINCGGLLFSPIITRKKKSDLFYFFSKYNVFSFHPKRKTRFWEI